MAEPWRTPGRPPENRAAWRPDSMPSPPASKPKMLTSSSGRKAAKMPITTMVRFSRVMRDSMQPMAIMQMKPKAIASIAGPAERSMPSRNR